MEMLSSDFFYNLLDYLDFQTLMSFLLAFPEYKCTKIQRIVNNTSKELVLQTLDEMGESILQNFSFENFCKNLFKYSEEYVPDKVMLPYHVFQEYNLFCLFCEVLENHENIKRLIPDEIKTIKYFEHSNTFFQDDVDFI